LGTYLLLLPHRAGHLFVAAAAASGGRSEWLAGTGPKGPKNSSSAQSRTEGTVRGWQARP